MPNPHLEAMIAHVNDDDLTEAKKINRICIAFSAWARQMKDAKSVNTAEQLKDLDIKLLETANTLLHKPHASIEIANMFSDPNFADTMLKKFDQMITKHAATYSAAARANKPLPKPPVHSASAAAATPTMFSASSKAATSASVKTLSLAPKPNVK
jgi:hypothetical protein